MGRERSTRGNTWRSSVIQRRQLLRRKQVQAESRLPPSTIYLRISQGLFPKPVRLVQGRGSARARGGGHQRGTHCRRVRNRAARAGRATGAGPRRGGPYDGRTKLAAALQGRRVGAGWMASCPAHDDRHPSLSIDGRQRWDGPRPLPRRLRPIKRDYDASRPRTVGRNRKVNVAASMTGHRVVGMNVGSAIETRRPPARRSPLASGRPRSRREAPQSKVICARVACCCRFRKRYASILS